MLIGEVIWQATGDSTLSTELPALTLSQYHLKYSLSHKHLGPFFLYGPHTVSLPLSCEGNNAPILSLSFTTFAFLSAAAAAGRRNLVKLLSFCLVQYLTLSLALRVCRELMS